MDPIEREIIRVLKEEIGGEPQPTDALTELGIDSLRMVDLASELAERFDVAVDQDMFEVETIHDLADYVRERSSGSDV